MCRFKKIQYSFASFPRLFRIHTVSGKVLRECTCTCFTSLQQSPYLKGCRQCGHQGQLRPPILCPVSAQQTEQIHCVCPGCSCLCTTPVTGLQQGKSNVTGLQHLCEAQPCRRPIGWCCKQKTLVKYEAKLSD